MRTRSVTFPGALGAPLAGRLELPPDAPRATAVFAHCFTCSKDLTAAVRVCRALAAQGIATLRFDFTGLGESAGEFADTTFTSSVDDLAAAARFLEGELGAPSLLVGHSLGGAAALVAAGQLPSVRAVATIAAPADPTHLRGLLRRELAAITAEGQAEVVLAGRSFTVRRELLDDLGEVRLRERLRDLRAALLILHSPDDAVVAVEHAARLYTAAPHPKSFVALAGADHMLSRVADADYAGAVLAAWASRYLEPAPPSEVVAPATPAAELAATTATPPSPVTARTRAGELRTEVDVRGHTLVADKPKEFGGEGAGPTPYDLVVAGLGACTSMTLQLYAARKGWPLDQAIVRLRHERVYAADQLRCPDEPARLDRVEREVELVGPLDDAQRERLLQIADRCPVHRTLHAGVELDTAPAGSAAGVDPGGVDSAGGG